MFDGIVRQMKKNKILKKFQLVDTKQDICMRIMNIDYVILLKGWWWTVMDLVAEGAHQGMTVQMEHTPWEDPLTDEAALISEFDLILWFSLVSELHGCLSMQKICTPHAIAVDMNI